jgi:hypothetical protein
MCKKLIYLVSFVLVLGLVLSSGAGAAAPSLVGWWKFNEDFLDSSGLGNDGIPEGNPTFVEGYVGFGLELDGNDYVVIDAVSDDFTDNDITLSAWVKTSDRSAKWFSCNTGHRGNQIRLCIVGGKFGFDTDREHALSTTTVSDGEWHLLTFVRSGNIGYTYVDGVMENSYEPAANYGANYAGYTSDFTSNDLWSIGQEWDGGGPSDHLTGIVDDARIYDRALLEAEILFIMEGGEGYPYAVGPKPADGAARLESWATLSWGIGAGAVSHDVYFGDNFDDVNNGTGGTFRGSQAETSFTVGLAEYPYPDGLALDTTYYWRIDEFDGTATYKGDVWSFNVLSAPSLVGLWKLDETEGAIAHDSAGAHDGTVNGEPLWQPTAGQINGALQLDGIDDYVSADLMLDKKDAVFSVFAWVKGGMPGQVVFSQVGTSDWLGADTTNGSLMTELRFLGKASRALQSQTVITDGNWHRIGLVWDGSNRILYADAVEVASDTYDKGWLFGGLQIGAGMNLDPGTFWSGLIDDVRIYNRAITP